MAEGDIGSVLGSLDFHPVYGSEPDIIHVSGHVYAIAYHGPSPYYGWLKTVTISDDGETLALTGSSLVFDTSQGLRPRIIHVSGNVYAIVYQGWNSVGMLKTVTISDDGATLALTGSSLEFDAHGVCPRIIHVSGNVYAIVYQALGNPGTLKTVTISDDGATLALTGGSLVFDATGLKPSIIHVSGQVYAIPYTGADSDGWLKTVTISDNGETLALTGSLEFDDYFAQYPSIIHVLEDVYAIAYGEWDDRGWLKTVTISDDGETLALITGGWLEFEDTRLWYRPSIIHVSGHVYAIAYEGPPGPVPDVHGWLKTVTISDDGATLALTGSSLEFDPDKARWPDIIHVLEDVYAIAYDGPDAGKLETVDIKTVLPTVTTDAATDVEATSATLNGTLDDDGGEACDVRFQYGETSDYGIDTEWQPGKESVVAFEQDITGLSPNKTYHFRAQVRNSTGTVNGADRTFKTPIGLPAVTTGEATGLGAIAATLNGTLDDDGSEACECGFEWGLDTGYGTTTPTENKVTGESFSQVIGGLVPTTVYHFRAFATNSAGIGHGADMTFTTAQVISRAFALAREEL